MSLWGGADFFDDLITHPEVEKAYERYLDGASLREGRARGETRIHAWTAIFELRASEVASRRPGDPLIVDDQTFGIQGKPEQPDPELTVCGRSTRGEQIPTRADVSTHEVRAFNRY
jgi:hypothetical protein